MCEEVGKSFQEEHVWKSWGRRELKDSQLLAGAERAETVIT